MPSRSSRHSVQPTASNAAAIGGLAEIAAALPGDTALVSLVRYNRLIFTSVAGGTSATRAPGRAVRTVPSYLGFVVRSTGIPAAVPLGAAATIDALVTEWRLDIRAEATAPTATADSPVRSSSPIRSRRAPPGVGSVEGPYRGCAHRPHRPGCGTLSLIPFAALPIGERSYLLETGPVIHYLSAERDLVASPPSDAARRGLLAVGGASFNDRTAFRGTGSTTMTPPTTSSPGTTRGASSECGSLQSVKFQPLTGTLQEVRDLSRLWDRYAASDVDADAARVLAGRGATETAFKREAGQHRVLHLATHGFFLDSACALSPTGTRGVGGLARARARARSRTRCCCRASPWPAPISERSPAPTRTKAFSPPKKSRRWILAAWSGPCFPPAIPASARSRRVKGCSDFAARSRWPGPAPW